MEAYNIRKTISGMKFNPLWIFPSLADSNNIYDKVEYFNT